MSAPFFFPNSTAQEASVAIFCQRVFESPTPAPWLLTLELPISLVGYARSYPQTRAVIDDFGNLVPVEAWQ